MPFDLNSCVHFGGDAYLTVNEFSVALGVLSPLLGLVAYAVTDDFDNQGRGRRNPLAEAVKASEDQPATHSDAGHRPI